MNKKLASVAAAVLSVALLATACSKAPEKTTDSKGTEQKVAKEAVLNTAWPYDVPPKSHFNVFATGTLNFPGGMFVDLMTSPFALYKWDTNSYEKQLAEDYTIDEAGKTVTVKIRKGAKWSDGTEVKADDALVYAYIGWGKSYAMWRYVDKVTKVDDYTVQYHMSNFSSIGVRYILRSNPQPSSVYGDWAKKYQAFFDGGKAKTSDEVKALNKEMDAFRPADYVSSGPFKMDTKSITEAQISINKRADAWNSSSVKIDKIVVYNGDTEPSTPLVLNKTLDFVTHAFPPATEAQFKSMGLRIIRFPYYTGPAIFFNNKNETFQKVEVRQAIAHAVNRDEAGKVALGDSGKGVKEMSGMADALNKQWLPADVQSKLNHYEFDLKKADDLMVKAGYKKGADGVYADAAGKKLEFEFSVPSDFTDWAAAAENVAQQLTKFGIKTKVRGTLWSQYTTDMNDGKFSFGMLPWGSTQPHPQFAYIADMITYNGGGKDEGATPEKPGQNFSVIQKYSGGEINFNKAITESGFGTKLEEQRPAVVKMAQAFNELLPIIPVFERYSNAPIQDGAHVTGWPKDGDALLNNGSADSFATLLIVNGTLTGVSK
ncbi:MAG TPA: ABC transporter substrate-binding protein [Symbiobacteriaceae bacterium]|nr:ABC transporter substrate-binding protein [Symbiobacteriaceae bacterium]